MADEEEQDCCPLCMEELDLTDKTFNACPCGYQVCLWCWHQIKNEYNGLCPACRTPYSELSKHKSTLDREDVVRRTKQRKQKEKTERRNASQSKHSTVNRKNLANVRVMQRNLVYVIGLPVHYADEETLRSMDCFGQYGKIIKAVVNKSHLSSDRANATASAYITFASKDDALACIVAIDGYYLDGTMLRASFGTTKYCNFFLRNLLCNNPDCLYLHELGDQEDSFTKEEMQSALHSGKAAFRDPSLTGAQNEVRAGDRFPTAYRPKPASASAAAATSTVADNSSSSDSDDGSDAQRKAQSVAAIQKLRQQSSRGSAESSTPPLSRTESTGASGAAPLAERKLDEPFSKIVSGGASSSSSSSARPEESRKPNLRVDTSSRSISSERDATENIVGPLEALKLATRSTSQEPAWAQPFPNPQVQPTSEQDDESSTDAVVDSVFSPFGLGFEGGIHRATPRSENAWPGLPTSAPSTRAADPVSSLMVDRHGSFPPPLPPAPTTTPMATASSGSSSLSFASIDAIFSQRSEPSEALAGLLGVQLSSTPLAHGDAQPKSARNSRFAFANQPGMSGPGSSGPPPSMNSVPSSPYASMGGVLPQRASPFGYEPGMIPLGSNGSFSSPNDSAAFPPLGMHSAHQPSSLLSSPFHSEFGANNSSASVSGGMNHGGLSTDSAPASGLAFLQQMLPNVNISYGGDYGMSNTPSAPGMDDRPGLFFKRMQGGAPPTDAWGNGGLGSSSLGGYERNSNGSRLAAASGTPSPSFYDPAIVSHSTPVGVGPNSYYGYGNPAPGSDRRLHTSESAYRHHPSSLVNNGN